MIPTISKGHSILSKLSINVKENISILRKYVSCKCHGLNSIWVILQSPTENKIGT